MLESTRVRSIPALLAKWVTERPASAALQKVHEQSTRTYSWGELAQIVYRWTAALHEIGVRPEDRVALWSKNRYEWIVCDLAIQNLRHSRSAARHIIREAGGRPDPALSCEVCSAWR